MALTLGSTARLRRWSIVCAAIGGAACSRPPAPAGAADSSADSASTAVELARVAQSLLDAVSVGDTSIWARYLSADGLFTDENGATVTKRELLAKLHPLPPGLSGHIAVANPQVRVIGDGDSRVAVITYDAIEEEMVFGQRLHTRYHETDTYLHRGGRWSMLASQTQVLPSEHTVVAVDPDSLASYAGTYELAPGVEYTVRRSDARLLGERKGRPPEELFPLGADRFFRRGAPRGEKLFVRDASGRVTSMIDRRDNNDLVWRRVR